MIPVSITYHGKKYTNQFPENWNELSRRQLLMYAKIINENFSEESLRLPAIVNQFLNIPLTVFMKMKIAELEELFTKIDFLTKESTLTKILISKFWIRGILYKGPADEFANNVVIDTGWFDHFFIQYCNSRSERDLDLTIACLYRPVNVLKWLSPFLKHADIRVKFNSESVESRADKFSKLPLYFKHAILFQFVGIRASQVKRYQRVYSKAEGTSENFGWLGLMIDLAGSKFGTVSQVEQSNMDQVLTFIEKSNYESQTFIPDPVNAD